MTDISLLRNKEIVEVDDYSISITKYKWLKSKKKIMKNVFVMGLVWMLLFTAYESIANLQSSLYFDEGLGTAGCKKFYLIYKYCITNIGLITLNYSKYNICRFDAQLLVFNPGIN